MSERHYVSKKLPAVISADFIRADPGRGIFGKDDSERGEALSSLFILANRVETEYQLKHAFVRADWMLRYLDNRFHKVILSEHTSFVGKSSLLRRQNYPRKRIIWRLSENERACRTESSLCLVVAELNKADVIIVKLTRVFVVKEYMQSLSRYSASHSSIAFPQSSRSKVRLYAVKLARVLPSKT